MIKPEQIIKQYLKYGGKIVKIAGEVRFIKDNPTDNANQWAFTINSPTQREIKVNNDFKFVSDNMSALEASLHHTQKSLEHALEAYNTFAKIPSSSISPDGKLGGRGYIQKITDIRKLYMNIIEGLSSIEDTFADETKAPHWGKEPRAVADIEVDAQEKERKEYSDVLSGDAQNWVLESVKSQTPEDGALVKESASEEPVVEEVPVEEEKVFTEENIEQFVGMPKEVVENKKIEIADTLLKSEKKRKKEDISPTITDNEQDIKRSLLDPTMLDLPEEELKSKLKKIDIINSWLSGEDVDLEELKNTKTPKSNDWLKKSLDPENIDKKTEWEKNSEGASWVEEMADETAKTEQEEEEEPATTEEASTSETEKEPSTEDKPEKEEAPEGGLDLSWLEDDKKEEEEPKEEASDSESKEEAPAEDKPEEEKSEGDLDLSWLEEDKSEKEEEPAEEENKDAEMDLSWLEEDKKEDDKKEGETKEEGGEEDVSWLDDMVEENVEGVEFNSPKKPDVFEGLMGNKEDDLEEKISKIDSNLELLVNELVTQRQNNNILQQKSNSERDEIQRNRKRLKEEENNKKRLNNKYLTISDISIPDIELPNFNKMYMDPDELGDSSWLEAEEKKSIINSLTKTASKQVKSLYSKEKINRISYIDKNFEFGVSGYDSYLDEVTKKFFDGEDD